jgi:hypothetical protein
MLMSSHSSDICVIGKIQLVSNYLYSLGTPWNELRRIKERFWAVVFISCVLNRNIDGIESPINLFRLTGLKPCITAPLSIGTSNHKTS